MSTGKNRQLSWVFYMNTVPDAAVLTESSSATSAQTRELTAIIAQLNELLDEEESDDHGILRANRASCKTACELLKDADTIFAREHDRHIPFGCASTDSEGGIRIEWVRPSSGVHLVVPATSEPGAYIYHEVGDVFGTEPATDAALARWLREIN